MPESELLIHAREYVVAFLNPALLATASAKAIITEAFPGGWAAFAQAFVVDPFFADGMPL